MVINVKGESIVECAVRTIEMETERVMHDAYQLTTHSERLTTKIVANPARSPLENHIQARSANFLQYHHRLLFYWN